MKGLSIEQKAKRFDEALEKSKRLYEQGTITESLCYIFPELKESEDDRIRKELIKYFTKGREYLSLCSIGKDDILAWLENIPYTIDHEKREGFYLGYKAGLEKQGKQNTNHKTMIVKFICKKDWHGIGDYYYGKIYNGYPCEKEQKGYDIYDDNHVPTFCDEDFIDEYFNIITEEKQSEQKPTNKVKPKFKVGDIIEKKRNSDINKFGHFTITDIFENSYWCDDAIICDISEQDEWEIFKLEPDFNFKVGQWIVATGKCTYCITKIDGFNVTLVDVDNNEYVFDVSSLNDARLWTIQDAKDGDILLAKGSYFKEYAFIYYGMTKDNVMSTYCGFDMVHNNFDTKLSRFGRMEDFEAVCPATKEQRDLLFEKMKEAGYEWNIEKKKLEIVDWSKHIKYEPNAPSIIEENPVWSEEDEKEYKYALKFVDNILNNCGNKKDYEHCKRCYDWLKSIKQKIKGE